LVFQGDRVLATPSECFGAVFVSLPSELNGAMFDNLPKHIPEFSSVALLQQPLEFAIAGSEHVVQANVVVLNEPGMEHLNALLSLVLIRIDERFSGGGGCGKLRVLLSPRLIEKRHISLDLKCEPILLSE